ncbi:MAG: ACP S-malonyltransferase [Actinobacteria bacterium]|uniref:[acyl-carrier-protein] S-malonyltransferase n=1 Tax=freshwater metagenome TaxID=449393 RepID=A0A6J6QQR0_9ZZZZ|nr:ACP S-malonyltransferase [Actinomycetota bacterium]MSW76402.1 ACP S-malonyltransferase [Actinomycetota bacterium]MSX55327.1 ACP S-malonyltransferase [Actinomycetota bacterium]MSX94751.1 ACP S-malonyltransferase [Actinomycetota bacterium]MSZ82290.1 ACP S-malonyltransferase [Actinomycetota bacterium]
MLAFTFPGQGSQRPGMGRPWADHESWELVQEASDVAGRDVARLLLDADADELRDTRNAQLTTFVSSLMVLDAVERLGIEPSFCAGHSLGEYTALTATGVLGFDEGVRLVCERSDAMHQAGIDNPGTMSAVLGLEDDQVDVACRRADSDVWVANFNAPGQVVIAGSAEGVARASAIAKELGAKKVMPLQVAGAFHTPFMVPARDRLRKAIAEANPRDSEVPVVSNVDSAAHSNGEEWSNLLSAQLSSPVRWKHTLLTLAELGVVDFAELGPGNVLTGMAKRTLDNARTISVASPDDLDKLLEWVNAGGPLAAQEVHEGEHLFAVERLVVSPSAGVFAPIGGVDDGALIEVGTVLGHIGDTEVRSPFGGILQSYIAVAGERVTLRQPIAWLRTV